MASGAGVPTVEVTLDSGETSMAVATAPIRLETTAPRQSVAAAAVPAPLPRQPIWLAESPIDQRPHLAASPDVLMLGILFGRNSG
jgi:hypothetical protein